MNFVFFSPGEYSVCGVLVSPLLWHCPRDTTLNMKRFPHVTAIKRKHSLRRRDVYSMHGKNLVI